MAPRKIVFFLTLLSALTVHGQFTYEIDQTIPVTANGVQLSFPWAGGLNSPQFNTIDLNGDNVEDLILFDRTADQFIPFLFHGNGYHYAPEYAILFPGDISQWALFRDFNCDGKKDIFTSDPFGMKAYVNTTRAGEPLSFREFNPGSPILTIGFNGPINLQMNSSDIPVIDDIDGDGDLDVLDARFVGVGSLEWHKNLSIENTGICDSMQFKRITQTWGNFEECNCGSYIFGTGACPSSGGRETHAAGKSSLTVDLDGDGDRDLLFSEETCSNLYLLPNTGTPDSAIIVSSTEFPSAGSPVEIQLFPAAYLEDVDHDSRKDIIVAPNLATRSSLDVNFAASVTLFKNMGTDLLPDFVFIKNNFMQDQMIDVGDNSVPAFFDGDGDQDIDMVIGNFIGTERASGLFYFENTGTTDNPNFNLVTDNYANLSSLNLTNLRPQFADADGDGKVDLAFTGTDGSNATSLFYIPNRSSNGLDIRVEDIVTINFNVGATENVLLTDIDLDGSPDVLLGKSTGSLEYWRNFGSNGTFNFIVQNRQYLGLTTSTSRQSLAMAEGDLDSDGTPDLVTGDQLGILTLFPNYRKWGASQSGIANILYNPITEGYETTLTGGHAWPGVANLDNSNKPSLISGNTLGGIRILKNDKSKELPAEPVFAIYPNPIPKGDWFRIIADRNANVQFHTIMGVRIGDEVSILQNQPYQFSGQDLAPGLYIARFSIGSKSYSRKFVIY